MHAVAMSSMAFNSGPPGRVGAVLVLARNPNPAGRGAGTPRCRLSRALPGATGPAHRLSSRSFPETS